MKKTKIGYGKITVDALRRATGKPEVRNFMGRKMVGIYFGDASFCPSWDEFVNVYRAFHGSNEDLDKPFIRNMMETELRRAINNMKAMIKN